VVGGPQYRVGSHRQFVLMARQFAAAGFAVIRFDYRGMGDSDGRVRSFESIDLDIRAGIDELLKQVQGLSGVVLFGLCDAASAVCMYVVHDHRVRGVVLANPWVRTAEGEARGRVRHHYAHRVLQKSFWKKLMSGRMQFGRSIKDLGRSLLHAGASAVRGANPPLGFQERMCRGLESFKGPTLFLLSGRDLTAREFEDACSRSPSWSRIMSRPSATTIKLPDADHTFSANADLLDMSNRCVEWATEARVA
jgi:exosortase A-associated hydrolase 1